MKGTRSACKGFVAVIVIVVLGSLGSAGHAQQITGKGEWHSLSGEAIKGTWTVNLMRSGSHLQGSLDLTGSNVFAGGDVSGNLDAASIMLGVAVGDTQHATFSGKLDGDTVSGEWTSDTLKDSGVWFGSLGALQKTAGRD
jgi:hypothetical protein